MTREQFFNSLNYFHLKPHVEDGRICFSGASSIVEARKALDDWPELEAEMILKLAANDNDLLDMIQERACIRWAEGYSDSLYMAVLCNIKETGATRSKELKPKTDWTAELSKYTAKERTNNE